MDRSAHAGIAAPALAAPAGRGSRHRAALDLTLGAFDPRHNSGRALYFIFCTVIVYNHAVVLGGYDRAPWSAWSNGTVPWGVPAVSGFFVMGGFFLTHSLTRHAGIWRFTWTRFLRVLPIFWLTLIGTAFVIAPLAVYWRNRVWQPFPWTGEGGAVRYVWDNMFVGLYTPQQYTIRDTLTGLPFTQAWNGSMWTLAPQFFGYAILILAIAIGLMRGRRWIAPVIAVAMYVVMNLQNWEIVHWMVSDDLWFHGTWLQLNLAPDHLNLIFVFFLGVTMYQFRNCIPTGQLAVVIGLAVLLFSFVRQDWYLCGSAAFAYLCLVALVRLPLRLGPPLGNLAFGIYLWGFPITQAAALAGWNKMSHFTFASTCMAATILVAAATHYWFEVPLARLVNHWRSAGKRRLAAEDTPTA